MKMKKQKVWAIVDRKSGHLAHWGNGVEFQSAVFPTRKEAKCFYDRNDASSFQDTDNKIARVLITEVK